MNNSKWQEAKKRVRELTNDIKGTIADFDKNAPGKVKKGQSGSSQRIFIEMDQICGYDLNMYVYQNKKDGVKAAFYALFNNETSMCYKLEIF